jgi:hypothetical protein
MGDRPPKYQRREKVLGGAVVSVKSQAATLADGGLVSLDGGQHSG